ncbi:eukaryotic translation initiation factor 2-alpha kinase 1-like isoform X1 [Colletes gigas]|uniref:eukaryotic translation initiation factor 2-alpha kinase 1-like isoform X1 n=1 Tax=Colletes gigas TaxID=935657 RepID=UPI001C9AE41A|nr:eukaryotic translation initiation factor 2-alpha kinase 1-like isoform X1 [Colletes gigas]
MDKTPSLINPWNILSTVTTFDVGSNTRSTICMDNNTNQSNGQIVTVVAPSTSLLIGSLIQQLCTLFEGDKASRNKLYIAICDRLHELKLIDSSYNLMEFDTLRGQYQQAVYQLIAVARTATGCENSLHISNPLMTGWSRYYREFEEISFIASGGFGNVYKALHRLDGIEYAVKKIIVRSGRVKSIMHHLEEVKTLAKLNHTNIVSYKGAWIEPTLPPAFLQSLPSTSHSPSKLNSADKRKSRYKSCANKSFNSQSQSNCNNSWDSQTREQSVYKENYEQDKQLKQHSKKIDYKSGHRIIENVTEESTEKTNSNSISFRNDSNCNDNETENGTNSTDGSDSWEESNSNNKLCSYVPPVNEQYATLYIQMTLCEKTLQQWLDERIELTSQTMIIAVLTQVLCGLDYIHSCGIVHHDIKPSNIFISTSNRLQIQLGDFGLACPLQSENRHSILGTHMYAAPEQLQGKCDPKSDIYSLGIVFLELLVHTETHMERIEIIQSLKRGQIPTTLTATYPKWAHIVSQLVQTDPKKRPSTSQLLQNLNEDKDVTIAQLRSDIIEKDNKIQKLEERISMLETQITKYNIPLNDT